MASAAPTVETVPHAPEDSAVIPSAEDLNTSVTPITLVPVGAGSALKRTANGAPAPPRVVARRIKMVSLASLRRLSLINLASRQRCARL